MKTELKKLLDIIISEHIKTANPVGSVVIANKYNLDVSPATIRQRMAELEELEYIYQPHTSAGRIPTTRSYKDYASSVKISNKYPNSLKDCQTAGGNYKELAKLIASTTNLATFWATHQRNLYYTGITNLLKQPEFGEINQVYDISTIIDQIDEIIESIYTQIPIGVNTLIADENPFGEFCSSIIAKYKSDQGLSMFGIIAPIRQDYSKNLNIINSIYNQLHEKKEK